jgi:hypothetical protein
MKSLSDSVFEQYEVVREASLDDERMPPLDAASQEIHSADTSTCAGDYTVASEVSYVEDATPALAPFTGEHAMMSGQDKPVVLAPPRTGATISRAVVPPLGLKGVIYTKQEEVNAVLGQGDIIGGVEGKAASGQGAGSVVSNVLPPLPMVDVPARGHLQAVSGQARSNPSAAENAINAMGGSGERRDQEGQGESIPRPEKGPWGGRRWVPKSLHYPRRAQVGAPSRGCMHLAACYRRLGTSFLRGRFSC